MTYHIEAEEEFNVIMRAGFNPLFLKEFTIDIKLRIEIQRQFFGNSELSKGDILKANEKFYKYIWNNKKHYCEECLKPLKNYSASFISHILSRGSSPEIAHDVRNVNILCLDHHNQWEFGNKKIMRIYPKNIQIIKTLKSEYANEKKY